MTKSICLSNHKNDHTRPSTPRVERLFQYRLEESLEPCLTEYLHHHTPPSTVTGQRHVVENPLRWIVFFENAIILTPSSSHSLRSPLSQNASLHPGSASLSRWVYRASNLRKISTAIHLATPSPCKNQRGDLKIRTAPSLSVSASHPLPPKIHPESPRISSTVLASLLRL